MSLCCTYIAHESKSKIVGSTQSTASRVHFCRAAPASGASDPRPRRQHVQLARQRGPSGREAGAAAKGRRCSQWALH
jgi:hypothetical protein